MNNNEDFITEAGDVEECQSGTNGDWSYSYCSRNTGNGTRVAHYSSWNSVTGDQSSGHSSEEVLDGFVHYKGENYGRWVRREQTDTMEAGTEEATAAGI